MDDAAIDACCLINLLAAGPEVWGEEKSGDAPFGLRLHAPPEVEREALYLMQPDEETEGRLVKTRIDLAPRFESGLLRQCGPPDSEEKEMFVHLAARLSDGEAACLAAAKRRGWLLATDDRKAGRIAREIGVRIVSTPELMWNWAKSAKANRVQVRAALDRIQQFARFVPRPDAPRAEWWFKHATRG